MEILKNKIETDFSEAYKAKRFDEKNFLGLIKGMVQTEEGKQVKSTDENVLKLLKKLEKSLNETKTAKSLLNQATDKETLELSWLRRYLPSEMTEDEIRSSLADITANTPFTNAGRLVGEFNKVNKGKSFDNKMVSTIANEYING